MSNRATTTPDLFSHLPAPSHSAPSVNPQSSSSAIDHTPTAVSASTHALPNDLPNAIKQLDDRELDRLSSAVVAEQKRRGRTVSNSEDRKQRNDLPTHSLTSGQVKAVRAAFKAGVTSSRIARQFGLSQADVRKALAGEKSKS
jgi:hypothetical protein